jgi:hypothetical protein
MGPRGEELEQTFPVKLLDSTTLTELVSLWLENQAHMSLESSVTRDETMEFYGSVWTSTMQ